MSKQCGITGKNSGQRAKEVANELEIDLSEYNEGPSKCSKTRVSKSKLSGNEISIPTMPIVA